MVVVVLLNSIEVVLLGVVIIFEYGLVVINILFFLLEVVKKFCKIDNLYIYFEYLSEMLNVVIWVGSVNFLWINVV